MSKIMKKVLIAVLAIVMALSFTILLAGCSDGKDGKSAYEIAKDNGFTGTEQEWLASLRGNNGYGVDGSAWHTGKGLPSDTTAAGAKVGDFYINLNTNTIYRKTASTWELIANINDNNNVSKWDGTIPGWTRPNLSDAEIVKNRPVSYVVDEDLHRIDLYNAEAFAWFAYRAVLGKQGFKDWTINLYCDVDLDNQMWIPIGLGARSNAPKMAFQGTFNGNGHTIYNLNSKAFYDSIRYGAYTAVDGTSATGYYISYMHKPTNTEIKIPFQVKVNDTKLPVAGGGNKFGYKEGDEFSYGLFAKTANATIRNLNIKGVRIDMPEKEVAGAPNSLKTDNVGALIGFAQGSITVENCTVGQFEHDSSVGYIKNCNAVAGIIGRCYAGTDAKGTGLANPTDEYGRIVIKDCTNNLDIIGAYGEKVAGIISYPAFFSNMVIENCINNGKLEGCLVGGMIAYRRVQIDGGTMTMRNCTNNGDIIATQSGGGMIGDRSTSWKAGEKEIKSMFTMQNCTNRGDIIAKTGEVTTSYKADATEASGYKVTKSYRTVSVGGLIGTLSMSALERSMFVHSNNSGNIIVNDYTANSDITNKVSARAGGLVGHIHYMKQGENVGQLTIACGTNGDVVYKAASDKFATNSYAKLTGDLKICIGSAEVEYQAVTDANYANVLNVIYAINTGVIKTETPAA